MAPTALSRTAASDAVNNLGWRYLLGSLICVVDTTSLSDAAQLVHVLSQLDGADQRLHLQLGPGRLEIDVQDPQIEAVTQNDVVLAKQISAHLASRGRRAVATGARRGPQIIELAIDAMNIGAIRPFWKAVLGYVDPVAGDQAPWIVDPAGQLAPVWFQQMDSPRAERNRIHFDVTVAHDEASKRVDAALAAGGRLLDDSRAQSFWVLADTEGNEACICTWLDRDERGW